MDETAATLSGREDVLAGRYTCRKETRAFYRARKTICHKFFFERSRSPIFARLLKHIYETNSIKTDEISFLLFDLT